MTHGVNIPHSCRVVRDLILSIINKGAGTPLIIVISRGFLFSELNRLLSDGILAEPNVPKGDCKGITFFRIDCNWYVNCYYLCNEDSVANDYRFLARPRSPHSGVCYLIEPIDLPIFYRIMKPFSNNFNNRQWNKQQIQLLFGLPCSFASR